MNLLGPVSMLIVNLLISSETQLNIPPSNKISKKTRGLVSYLSIFILKKKRYFMSQDPKNIFDFCEIRGHSQ